MIIDKQQMFSDAQALTATAASTDKLDFRKAAREIGIGKPMALVIALRTKADDADGDETYTAKLEVDDSDSFGSVVQIGPTITIPRGTAKGTMYVLMIPPDKTWEQYARITYTLGGTTPSVTVDAWITSWDGIQNDAYYKDAIVIS